MRVLVGSGVFDDGIRVGDEVGTKVLIASEEGVSDSGMLEGDKAIVEVFVGWGVSFTIGVFVAWIRSVLDGTVTSIVCAGILSRRWLRSLAAGTPKIIRERARMPSTVAAP